MKYATIVLLLSGALACNESQAGHGGAVDVAPDVAAAPTDPIEFGSVPPFELTSQSGERVTLETLRGRPFAVAAIFTTCYGPCPRITTNMRRLQDELEGTDVRLVSISVDPETDTPEVLAEYARSYGADPERWLFLTGREEEIHRFVREGLWMGVARAAPDEAVMGMQVTHATQILAVDREGRRRGWYDGEEPAGIERVRDRLLHLAREPREPQQGK